MRHVAAALVLTALSPLALTGCDTTKAPGSSIADPLPPAAYPQIVVDKSIEGYIANGVPKVERARIMSVTVPIRAVTDKEDLRVQYRFIFLDKNGVPIGADPDWRYTQLQSRNQTFLKGNAIDAGAEDWRMEIRPAR